VMELVQGSIISGPRQLAESLSIARQITQALEYAHAKGIIHRDLKPSNVKVTPEGIVKVLDFGLAKAYLPEAAVDSSSDSPTVSIGTRSGEIMGTTAYMSPEQARGKKLDKRTDIWSFGCVLYEMLAGRKTFAGESDADIVTAILQLEPDWSKLPLETPTGIRALLRRCLQKDPERRLHDIADARLEIEEAGTSPAILPSGEPIRRPVTLAVAAITLLVFGIAAGMFWHSRRAPEASAWQGDLMGGSTVSFGPRISPDGSMLAFQAMVKGQNQVAVMKPGTGNWTVLTRDRSKGLITDLSWSRDGTKIYFDRYLDVPGGVYNVPALGGEERLVVEDAVGPQALPDGSLLVTRVNPDRRKQVYRFWPETRRLEALPVFPSMPVFTVPPVVFPDGKEAVFFGKTAGVPADAPDRLYAIDLADGRTRMLAPEGTPGLRPSFPLAVHPDNRWFLYNLPAGNLYRIVAAPRDGGKALRTVTTFTTMAYLMDVGPDESLYVDQMDRPGEVMRFSASGGATERIAVAQAPGIPVVLPLPEGRVLFSARVGGKDQLLVAGPGKDPVPLVDTQEEAAAPAALVGDGEIAFLAGSAPNRTIVIASAADGRILRRLDGAKGAGATLSLAASPDGKTLYYTASGSIWAIPSTDGEPRKIGAGESVTADPRGQELIVQQVEKDRNRLVRVPLGGGAERSIPVRGELHLTAAPLSSRAVRKDGRVVLTVSAKDSWFWQTAILDPETGKLEKVPALPEADTYIPCWTSDGRMILTVAVPIRSAIWRFRPAGRR